MERFCCNTQIISGKGALGELKNLGARRLLVVTDPYFMKNGRAQQIAHDSHAEKTEFFSEITPDPSVELVARGTAAVRQLQPDTVVALGGGSAMDCAKAMTFFAGGQIRLVAIPTTSGSGSEVTDFAILTHNGVKHPLIDETLRPQVAILDEELLTGLPKSLIADTGFDVLAHAVEAIGATAGNAMTCALAREAFCTVFAHLGASYRGDLSVRGQIHLASTMAGMAFSQAGLGLCHSLSHSLGGLYHVPHGRLNAILLPAVVEVNASQVPQPYAQLAGAVGLGGATQSIRVRNLKNGLCRLRRELNLPASLQEVGIRLGTQKNAVIEAALADPCSQTNPVSVDYALAQRVLAQVSGGG